MRRVRTARITFGQFRDASPLFPGGPGRTKTHEDLETEIESITTRLHTLDADTIVLPGHGPSTTIEASRAEYEEFASRDHDPDLHGDVLWAES